MSEMQNTNLIEMAALFNDEDRARDLMERLRWPDGIACPRCGCMEVYTLTAKPGSKRPVRKGVRKCKGCRKQFTVTVGTIFESSHIPLGKWLAGIYLMSSSKKGFSAHQLHRSLGITYKSAWFMAHRIREAMKERPLSDKLSGIVEVDETYVKVDKRKKRPGRKTGRATVNKAPVTSLISRRGEARSFAVPNVKKRTLHRLIRENVEGKAMVMTDGFPAYAGLEDELGYIHETVDHSKEYVRGLVSTNFAESFFSLLKRGILGSFHHVSERHLHRYLAEFDFRWSRRELTDGERMAQAVKAADGKRLTFRPMARPSR